MPLRETFSIPVTLAAVAPLAVEYLRAAVEEAKASSNGLTVTLIPREKGDANAPAIATLISALRGAGGGKAILGSFLAEVETGAIAESWVAEVAAAGITVVDATKGVEAALGLKDDAAIAQVRDCGGVSDRAGEMGGEECLPPCCR